MIEVILKAIIHGRNSKKTRELCNPVYIKVGLYMSVLILYINKHKI